MRFEGLRELTTLPAERLESAFRSERVTAVLPVSELGSGLATVLVATPRKIGIVTLRRVLGRSRWVTRWAPWDAVRLSRPGVAERESRTRSLPRAIDIGGHEFRIVLGGAPGRQALREFNRSVRRRHRALLGSDLVPAA